MALQNLALMLWKADYRNIRIDMTTDTTHIGFLALSTPRIIAFFIAIGASVLLYLSCRKPIPGGYESVAQNSKAAQLMGINLKKTYGLAFTIGITLVGLAGLLLSPIYPAFPLVGSTSAPWRLSLS